MDDETVIEQINRLAAEEHDLWEREARGEANDAERERAKELEVMLDQSWDLLHQRRARRAAGMNPDDAEVRGAAQVEGYLG
jgi:vacuolar-type H+-ATPase subunit E/Vma4